MPLDFKKLMTARFFFTLAVEMQAVTLGWRMYVLTEDPMFLGFIGLAEAVPALGLALYAGYLVDNSRPLVVFRSLLFVSLLSAGLLFFSQTFSGLMTLKFQIIALFCSSFLTGTARAFSQPSIYAMVPRLVTREQLPKSSAWMTAALQVARISGPALAGLLFGIIGVAAAAGVICFWLLLSLVSSLLISVNPAPPATQGGAKARLTKTELLSGAKFVFAHPFLLPALSLDMISVLFGGVTALLPIYAAEILKVGPKGLGVLRSAPAIGAVLTGIWLTRMDFRRKAGTWLFTAVIGFGICILVFAVSQNYMLSLIALGLSGAFDSISMVIRTAIVQLSSPDHMRGRISAVNSIFIGSSNELGEFESGMVAKVFGTVPAAVFGGVMCLVTVFTVGIFSPRLRTLDLHEMETSAV